MRSLFLVMFFFGNLLAHPVSYTIDLELFYDESNEEVKVVCKSNSKNKCGLYNFHLMNEDESIITTVKYPFLKKYKKVSAISKKPYKVEFFLRKVPEHKYVYIFE